MSLPTRFDSQDIADVYIDDVNDEVIVDFDDGFGRLALTAEQALCLGDELNIAARDMM